MNAWRLAYYGIFLYVGTFGPYWVYFLVEQLGFTQKLAGALFALLVACSLVGGLSLTRLADRRRMRLVLQRATSGMAVVICGLWLFVDGPVAAVVVAMLQGAVIGCQIPLLDGGTLDALGPRRARFGRIRLFGTLGFATSSYLVGIHRDAEPMLIIVAMVAGMAFFHATTWRLPDSQAHREEGSPLPSARMLLGTPGIVALLCGTYLHGVGAAAYETFVVLHLKGLGLDEDTSALIYPMAMGSEVVCFFLIPGVLQRVSASRLAAFALVVASLRWVVMATVRDPVVLVGIQVLHGISFGAWYAASLHVLSALVPPHLRNTGQGLFSVTLLTGFGCGALLHGWLRDTYGGPTSFFTAAGLALCAALIVGSIRNKRPLG